MSGGCEGVGAKVVSGTQNSVPSAALQKHQSLAVRRFHGTLLLSSTFSFKIFDRFMTCQLGR